jgi:hypothetical protein
VGSVRRAGGLALVVLLAAAALGAAAWPGAGLAATAAPSPDAAYDVARSLALAGPRPAGSTAERRAHARVEQMFRDAGLRIGHDRFAVPGKGSSRNVLGIRDGRSHCLRIFMAHSDSVPPAPGADDNASGVGTLTSLAAALGAGGRPRCDVWLVATGAEERPYTRAADHLGALALVRRIRRFSRAGDVEFALSLDEVGRGTRFWLRSPAPAPRHGVERRLLAAASRVGVSVRWVRDTGSGNSDHRELALAGMPAMKLGVPDDPARHTARDTAGRLQRRAFVRVLRVVAPLLG